MNEKSNRIKNPRVNNCEVVSKGIKYSFLFLGDYLNCKTAFFLMRSQEKRTVIIDLLLKETNNTAAEILNAQGNRNPIKETSKRGGDLFLRD